MWNSCYVIWSIFPFFYFSISISSYSPNFMLYYFTGYDMMQSYFSSWYSGNLVFCIEWNWILKISFDTFNENLKNGVWKFLNDSMTNWTMFSLNSFLKQKNVADFRLCSHHSSQHPHQQSVLWVKWFVSMSLRKQNSHLKCFWYFFVLGWFNVK